MVDSALDVLMNEQAAVGDRLVAINDLVYYVESETHDAVYLTADATTDRIRDVCIRLLDLNLPELPTKTLIWVLGKMNDPSLVPHYKRWLRRLLPQLKSTSGAVHQTLCNLDLITDNVRSASVLDVEENIRRAESYVDKAFPW